MNDVIEVALANGHTLMVRREAVTAVALTVDGVNAYIYTSGGWGTGWATSRAALENAGLYTAAVDGQRSSHER